MMRVQATFMFVLLCSAIVPREVLAKDHSVELTDQNFDQTTAGKTVFIKFFSPTCAHCRSMGKDWDRMAEEWVGHKQGLVGAVDCTTQSKICNELKITGVPTLLYGEPVSGGILLLEYTSDKIFSEMSKFANQTLINPICSPVNLETCKEKDRTQMLYFLSLGTWELGSVIKDQLDMIQMAKDTFHTEFDAMQSTYDLVGTDHEIFKSRTLEKIKMLKEIIASRTTK